MKGNIKGLLSTCRRSLGRGLLYPGIRRQKCFCHQTQKGCNAFTCYAEERYAHHDQADQLDVQRKFLNCGQDLRVERVEDSLQTGGGDADVKIVW